jgi:hypothetical protein
MRFIIHEQPYERPLLAGQLRYERDGQPTGAVESWRLSEAADGYRFLRVDLDARAAASGRSWLYHVTLAPDGRPEQVKARFWDGRREVATAVVREGNEWLAARQVDDAHHEDVARGDAFWFPAAAGLAFGLWFVVKRFGAALSRGEERAKALNYEPALEQLTTSGVTLLLDSSDGARMLALVATPVTIDLGVAAEERVGDEVLPVRPLSVAWGQNRRTVWLDDDGRPLRLWRDDGLTATAERLLRYGM